MTTIPPSVFLFVINPVAGGKQKKEHEEAIQKAFSQLPHSTEYFFSEGKNDAYRLERMIEKIKPQIVVAVGGDGTLSMVAKIIIGKNITLGILPAGSANGMAAELNIPENIQEALSILLQGKTRDIDVLSVNNLMCIHLSDLGLNARLIKYFENGNMRGKLGYARVAIKVLLRMQYMHVTIKTKDTEIQRKAFMVVIANASKYGTGAVINSEGDLQDGLFEVVVVKKLGLLTLFKLWLNPRALGKDKVEVIQANAVQVHTKKRMPFQVDGEYVGKVYQLNAKLLPHKLRIISPE